MVRFTCGECLGSAFVLCFTQCEALRGDVSHLQGVSGFSIVFFFTQFEALPGDPIHLQGVYRFNICIAFCTV